jgi:hypothetical protein
VKDLALASSPRSRKLFWLALSGLLILLIAVAFALLPSPVDVPGRLADWFRDLLPHPIRFWKESPWLY